MVFIILEMTKSLWTRNRSMKTCRFSLFWYLRITQTKLYYKYISKNSKNEHINIRQNVIYLSSDLLQTENWKIFYGFTKNENWMWLKRISFDTFVLVIACLFIWYCSRIFFIVIKYWQIKVIWFCVIGNYCVTFLISLVNDQSQMTKQSYFLI